MRKWITGSLFLVGALAFSACGYSEDKFEEDPLDDPVPTTVEDPVDSDVDPSLDLRGCDAAHDPNGDAWISCDMEGSWQPDENLYSWYMSHTLQDAKGTPLLECVFQRHDGIDLTFCDVGNADDFSVTHSTTGFVSVFANTESGPGSTFTMESGVLPESNGTLASDTLTGSFGEDPVPVPESN